MLEWKFKKFQSLTLEELYNIMRLRQEVFVVEQNCVFIDADHYDEPSYHLLGYHVNDELIAYARIVPPGIIYPEPSIGRVVTSLKYRKAGYGKLLMEKAMEETYKLYNGWAVRIEAQKYLLNFYEGFGFVTEGKPYLLDGIEHVIMVRAANLRSD